LNLFSCLGLGFGAAKYSVLSGKIKILAPVWLPVDIRPSWFEVILVVSIHWLNFRILRKHGTLNILQQSNGQAEMYVNIAKN